MDLVGDHLQVPEGRLILAFGLRQFGLPLVHVLLQVLEGRRSKREEGDDEGHGRQTSTCLSMLLFIDSNTSIYLFFNLKHRLGVFCFSKIMTQPQTLEIYSCLYYTFSLSDEFYHPFIYI